MNYVNIIHYVCVCVYVSDTELWLLCLKAKQEILG